MTRDYRDALIELLADREADLGEEVGNLTARIKAVEAQRDAYRLVAVQFAYRVCDMRKASDALEERYHRALEDARHLRTQFLTDRAEAAA